MPDTDVAQDLEDYGVDRRLFRVVVWARPGLGASCLMPLRMSGPAVRSAVKYRTHRHTTISFNDKPYSDGSQGLPRDIADLGGTRYRPVGTGGPRICAYKPTSQGTGVLGRVRANYLACLGFTHVCLVQGETLHRTISRTGLAAPRPEADSACRTGARVTASNPTVREDTRRSCPSR